MENSIGNGYYAAAFSQQQPGAADVPYSAHTIEAHTLEAHTLEAHTLEAHTLGAHTLEAHTLERDDDRKPPAMSMPDHDHFSDNLDSKLAAALAGEAQHDDHDHDHDDDDEQKEMPDFTISNLRRKNASGALICMAVGCEKNAQAKTKINDAGGFCRIHYNAWLISTGQVDSWDCDCGNKVSVESDRCGNCHRWKEKRSYTKAIAARARVKNEKGPDEVAITHVPENAGVEIANVRLTNEKGRSLCKVIGCNKLDQAKNDGFCRFHFNMFSIAPLAHSNDAHIDHGKWTCVCGELISGKQKRCGKCNKWRGGKREPYTTISKKARLSNETMITTIVGHWTCDCGNNVSSTKSRCGKCHHWRGGKRKGGWKIRPTDTSGGDGGIEWTQDWSCCEVIMPAKKRRCGKCHKWRGGKRFSTGSSGSGRAADKVDEKVDEYAITEFI